MSMLSETADAVRLMCKSLGHDIPQHWTDKQVVEFVRQLIEDAANAKGSKVS